MGIKELTIRAGGVLGFDNIVSVSVSVSVSVYIVIVLTFIVVIVIITNILYLPQSLTVSNSSRDNNQLPLQLLQPLP